MTAHAESKSNYKLELLSAHAVWDATCGPYDEGSRVLFSPQMVIERYELSHQSEMTREPLKDWMAFENCQVDWDYHDFERMILTGIDSDVYLFLVTDEGLMERSVFGFRRADFRDFAVWYETS